MLQRYNLFLYLWRRYNSKWRNMKRTKLLMLLALLPLCVGAAPKIYHKGWIDFNKNGKTRR